MMNGDENDMTCTADEFKFIYPQTNKLIYTSTVSNQAGSGTNLFHYNTQ